jgi:hypothetical protein
MGFLVRAKPRVESDERSFLKGLVGKRLEEMESGTPPIDPLELLGLTGSARSLVPNAAPTTSPSIEEAPTTTSPADTTTTAPSKLDDGGPKSPSPIQSVIAESLSSHTDSVVSGSVSTDCIPSTLQTAHSPQHSLRSESPDPAGNPHPPASPQSVFVGEGLRARRLLQTPRTWITVAWALHSYRDTTAPTRTRPVSYPELAKTVGKHEDSVRRVVLQLIDNGLLVRTSLLQYSSGGSIYSFGEAFPSLLVAQPPHKTAARTFTTHSLQDSLHPSGSSSFLSNQELLQEEVPVNRLILAPPFEELDRRSLLPFVQQVPSLGYLQDFIDKVVAVIEQKKPSPKPIADPVAFLFGCLKKMEINPPPGWKSRAVRMLEEEERRLKTEAEELRAAGSRVERQRCELYFLQLSPDKQAEITRETETIGERDIPMIQAAKREQRYLELIRALMRHETTTSSG